MSYTLSFAHHALLFQRQDGVGAAAAAEGGAPPDLLSMPPEPAPAPAPSDLLAAVGTAAPDQKNRDPPVPPGTGSVEFMAG